MSNNSIPLLCVAITTYNHENYIEQALKSVLSQKTNFDFKIIIGEDHSTDDTQKICKKFKIQFPEKIILIEHERNVGLIENYRTVLEKATCKYVAFLEGDDYWIDDEKLQKQVDIMENNPSIGLVHSSYNFLSEGQKINKTVKKINISEFKGDVFEKLFYGNFIAAGTVCFRKELYDKYVDLSLYKKLNVQTIDGFIWIDLAKNCLFDYIETPTLMYRILNNSISNNKDYLKKKSFQQSSGVGLLCFYEKYNPNFITKTKIESRINNHLFLLALSYNQFIDGKYYFNSLCFNNKYLIIMKPFIQNSIIFHILSFIYSNIKKIRH